MSDPDAPQLPAGTSANVPEDTVGYLVWVAGFRGSDFANQLGAAIAGAEGAGLDWADVMTAAQRIATHGDPAQELTEEVRAWVRRGGAGRGRTVRLRREAPLTVARPPHCGQCDPVTRQTLTDPPGRCPACHPLTQNARETA
jgi:hypothetical protein